MRRRLSRILRAGRPRAQEDPVRAVQAAQARQEELVEAARRSVADVAVHRRRVEILAGQARAEVTRLTDLAGAAVAAGDDDAARELLRRSLTAEERERTLLAQHRGLDAQVAELERALGRLEARAEEAALRFQALRADHDVARASLGMREAAGREAVEAGLAADRAEQEVRRLQAHAAARAELAWSDPDSPEVRDAFDRLGTGLAAERELERLKQRRAIDGS